MMNLFHDLSKNQLCHANNHTFHKCLHKDHNVRSPKYAMGNDGKLVELFVTINRMIF